MRDVKVIGVDLGKNVCSLVGLDAAGAVVLRRRVRREGLVALLSKLPGSVVVAMEACCGAHYLGRLLTGRGLEVRLMSPEYVRPYVKAQKNDDRDAEAIAEAATRPTMRFVALKTEAQLDVQVLHRVRDRLVGQRTSLMNQVRSLLLERGIVVPQGRRSLLDAVAAVLAEGHASELGRRIRLLLEDMLDQWRALDTRIAALDDEFAEMTRRDPAARRLATIPGVGVMNATALVAAPATATCRSTCSAAATSLPPSRRDRAPAQPFAKPVQDALITRRSSTRGLPPRCGSNGSIAAHCASLSQNRSVIDQPLLRQRGNQIRHHHRNGDRPE